MFYTYIWFDPKTNVPIYVGKGKDGRAMSHIKKAFGTRLSNTLRKRKEEGFILEPTIIPAVDEDDAFEMENCLINLIGREDLGRGPLFNLTDGGEGTSGFKMPSSSIEKCRVAGKKRAGWVMSQDTKDALSAAHTGMKASLETKKKMSATRIGKVKTPEHQARITASLQGLKYESVECPHCGKCGGGGNMKRYHFDNCKSKGVASK